MSPDAVRSRRALLTAAAGAVAATAAAAVAIPDRVLAGGSDGLIMHVGEGFVDVRLTTYLENKNNDLPLVRAISDGAGSGFWGSSSVGSGVLGDSATGVGVWGETSTTSGQTWGVYGHVLSPDGAGVFGHAQSTTGGIGVYGEADGKNSRGVVGATTDTTSETYGVLGTTQGTLGRGVFGWSLNEAKGGTGVWGQSSAGTGVAVRGYAWDGYGASGKFGTGVMGTSGSHAFPPPVPLPNTGVYGIGLNGRGGVFYGDRAQLKLVPSSAASHPASGQKGDLFVDTSGRLWFCQGGSGWKQLA